MVLKLLQGPIVCTADPNDDDTAGFDVLLTEASSIWLDDHGIIGAANVSGYGARAGPGSMIVVNLDGVFYVRNKKANTPGLGKMGYDYITQNAIACFGLTTPEYPLEPWTGSWIEAQAFTVANDWSYVGLFRLPDRWLTWAAPTFSQAEMASCALDEVQADLVSEYVFDPGFGTLGIWNRMIPGRDGLIYLSTDDSVSTIATYDWQRRTEILPRKTLGIASETVLYSPKFDIFISLHDNTGNQEMRIWSNEN